MRTRDQGMWTRKEILDANEEGKMTQWLRIAGAWRVPVKIVLRSAVDCDLPPRWMSKTRPPSPGPEAISPTPLMVRHSDTDIERINWLAPGLFSQHFARADQIQVFEIDQSLWTPTEVELEFLRFLTHAVASVALGEHDTNHRRTVIRTLYEREDLRNLVALHVFEGMAEHKVLQPKQLMLLFRGTVSRETCQADIQFARLAPLHEKAKPVYDAVRSTHPELPTMRDLVRAIRRKRASDSPEGREEFVADALTRIASYHDSTQSELDKLGDKLTGFVQGSHNAAGNVDSKAL